ncbi:hypothetical protein LCGC14_0802920 [marine sediment metagenome]|uniref:Uncharacterized protein n=1 Tax=marine sediment metagenome TaxID=412755 RepID=A0A0F9Q8Y6_9ZZZZ
MFNLKEFEENSVLVPIVEKLNRFLSKNKTQKVTKLLEELVNFLDQSELIVEVIYILSIIAEHDIDLITPEIFLKVKTFINSDNDKLRINSIIIIGFTLIAKHDLIQANFNDFAEHITDDSKDIRDNIHYFLLELIRKDPTMVNLIKDQILDGLSIEKNKENILSLLILFEYCKKLNFDQLYRFREISKSLFLSYFDDKKSEISVKLLHLNYRFFPGIRKYDQEVLKLDDLLVKLEKHFIMKKYSFKKISKQTGLTLKESLIKLRNSPFKENKLYFYIKSKKNGIFIFELEKSKLVSFIEENLKISKEKFQEIFAELNLDDSSLNLFIQTLISLKIIDGYYSELGFYYSRSHIKSLLLNDLIHKGLSNLKKFNYLPPLFMKDIIQDIKKTHKDKLLLGKNKNTYYSLKKIQVQINSEAAKSSVVDLKSYRDRLIAEDFINLIKNLPREYLSNFHKRTQWLTNLGTLKITKEVEHSKIVGFFDFIKISKKLNIGQMLLLDVFDEFIDYRSGVWDKHKEVFYFSKYLNERIEIITQIKEKEEKLEQIIKLAKKLKIDKNHIAAKIDENLRSIAKEIKTKDEIRISDYIEKTGMTKPIFMKFIKDLGISYFKKADLLIFSGNKIEEAKNDIKRLLLDRSKSVDYLTLGNFEIMSDLIKDLINNLLQDGKLKGVFYEQEGEVLFYTELGIQNLMLENSFMFSFNDLFYEKELGKEEINLMKENFNDLIKERKLIGDFDEETLTFTSDEVLFAKDYNTVLFEFEKNVKYYVQIFEEKFLKIKKILQKKDETIFPQEIKLIQEIIDKLNGKCFMWRNSLEGFIIKANAKLLKDQGFSVKKYKTAISAKEKEDIKSFEEDPEVFDNLKNFNAWIKLFNKIEVKYPNLVFYQKRLINNPGDKESKNKLNELLIELFLT